MSLFAVIEMLPLEDATDTDPALTLTSSPAIRSSSPADTLIAPLLVDISIWPAAWTDTLLAPLSCTSPEVDTMATPSRPLNEAVPAAADNESESAALTLTAA